MPLMHSTLLAVHGMHPTCLLLFCLTLQTEYSIIRRYLVMFTDSNREGFPIVARLADANQY